MGFWTVSLNDQDLAVLRENSQSKDVPIAVHSPRGRVVRLGNTDRTIRVFRRPRSVKSNLRKPFPTSPKTFSDHIRFNREERGLTPREFAQKWGFRLGSFRCG